MKNASTNTWNRKRLITHPYGSSYVFEYACVACHLRSFPTEECVLRAEVGVKTSQGRLLGNYDNLRRIWVEADRLGFHSGWLFDHLFELPLFGPSRTMFGSLDSSICTFKRDEQAETWCYVPMRFIQKSCDACQNVQHPGRDKWWKI